MSETRSNVGRVSPVFHNFPRILAGVERRGVIHIGAHKGQEVSVYRSAGFGRIVLVEPNSAYWPILEAFDDVEVHRCAAGPAGVGTLHITRWAQRSSLLKPNDYPVKRVEKVDVRPVSELQGECNVAVLDIQGAELAALETADLDRLDVVVVECYDKRRYQGAAVTSEIDAFMSAAGFRRKGQYQGHSKPTLVDVVWRNKTCAL